MGFLGAFRVIPRPPVPYPAPVAESSFDIERWAFLIVAVLLCIGIGWLLLATILAKDLQKEPREHDHESVHD